MCTVQQDRPPRVWILYLYTISFFTLILGAACTITSAKRAGYRLYGSGGRTGKTRYAEDGECEVGNADKAASRLVGHVIKDSAEVRMVGKGRMRQFLLFR